MSSLVTPLETVQQQAKEAAIVPVCRELLADTETPISALLKMSKDSDCLFLLESVEGGERNGRWTFLGSDPFLTFESRGKDIVIRGEEEHKLTGDPLAELKRLFDKYRSLPVEGLPPFTGGAVGCLAYDTIRLKEDIPNQGRDEIDTADILFGFYDALLIFDNLTHKLLLVANARCDLYPVEEAYSKALRKIDGLLLKLARPFDPQIFPTKKPSEVRSNFTQTQYEERVDRCKEYIRAGDAFQIVLSQRLSLEPGCEARDIYRSLRTVNPSDYMYYLKFSDVEIVGASPELLVQAKAGGLVRTRPIAGTRPRGETAEQDAALEIELMADEKEKSEHLMLVDLGRNDIGRVAEIGTVRPTEFMQVHRYSKVMHIVSTVEGKLREGVDPLDALLACFPAGTLSGAPKIRAMEIIDELEGLRRGFYGGAIGYRDFNGNLDTCIAIRTLIMKNGTAHIQAGAGIVADSVPEKEFEETLHKADAILKAIERVSAFGEVS